MKSVKIAELKDRLSEHLRAVEQGDEVVVTDRNRPIARIVSIELGQALTLEPAKVPFARVRRKRWPAARWKLGSDALLAEERRER